MAEVAKVATCSNPGCDQPGTSSCSACKATSYCCVTCQTADWPHHREECPGHLRKMGKANLAKAQSFEHERDFVQTLRFADIAATKLKQLKDRSLGTVELINDAMVCKFNALGYMGRYKEAMACAEENYTLWAMNQMRNPGSIDAALALIQSCLHNNEYERAEHYARHAMFMINEMTDNFIPADELPSFLARASRLLARSIYRLAESGGIPPAEKQKAGEEAVTLARQALKLDTQLFGKDSAQVAHNMTALANVLDYFNDVDDDEVFRLRVQSNAIYSRVEGSSSLNVAIGENQLGNGYSHRAKRVKDASGVDRHLADLELALTHYRAACRIYRVINHVQGARETTYNIDQTEEHIRGIRFAIAAEAAAFRRR